MNTLFKENTFNLDTSGSTDGDYLSNYSRFLHDFSSEDLDEKTTKLVDISRFNGHKAQTKINDDVYNKSSFAANYEPKVLAEWEGYVVEVSDQEDFFAASLTGIRGQGVKGEEEDALIPISDVSESDMSLLSPGNFFRLCVKHEIDKYGQPRRYSQLVFRRLPAYREEDLLEAMDRGRKLARSLRVE
jgi:hypothetical protein